jgi:acetylornithine deacetylase/succinyl-diaminopimelate desuccinylase-like protein
MKSGYGRGYCYHSWRTLFSTNPDHEFITALRDAAQGAGITPRIEGFSAVADLAWYSKWGVPGALFGAGDVRLAHGPD